MTGVQTCALPISLAAHGPREEDGELQEDGAGGEGADELDGFW